MFGHKGSPALSIAAILAITLAFTLPAAAQGVLYDNGPDGNVGYYHVNFGAVVTNSFILPTGATVTNAALTIYSVDDRNAPQRLKWTITTEPFGGMVKGEGFVNLTLLENPYPTRFQLFAWEVGFAVPNITLPAGTYYLQIQDVVTVWDTWAFWAQSSGGSSQAYYEPIGQNGAGGISEVPSESFRVYGEWSSEQVRSPNRR